MSPERPSRTGGLAMVLRQPEAPRGLLLVSPRIARGSALVAAGLLILLSAAVAIVFVSPELELDDRPMRHLMTLVHGLAVAAGLAVLPVVAQCVAAATGRRGLAAGLAASGLGAALGLLVLPHVDLGFRAEERLATLAFGAGTIWLSGSVAAITIGRPSRSRAVRRHRRIAAATLIVAAASVLVLIVAFFGGLEDVAPGPGSGSILIAILTVTAGWGTFLGLVMSASTATVARRDERKRARAAETVPADAVVAHDCPGCGVARELPRGVHRCDRCGTRVRIVIEEPRCRCGYVLFRLPGTRCPECGRDIPDAERYAADRFDAAAARPTPTPPDQSATDASADASPPAPAEIDSDTSDDPPAS